MNLDMICTCTVAGVKEVELRRIRIFNKLCLDECNKLTTAIVLSLGFDFQAEAEIYMDQWFGVSLETSLLEKDLFIQCDDPGDGLAALWEYLVEKFPDKLSVNSRQNIEHAQAAVAVADALFQQYKTAETSYRDHRVGHSDEEFCDECSRLLSILNKLHYSLNNYWGLCDLDVSIEKLVGD